MANGDYYGYGVDGSHPYFNQPDPPECPRCACRIEREWDWCPYCGTHIDWGDVEQYGSGFDGEGPVSRPMRAIYDEMMGRARQAC